MKIASVKSVLQEIHNQNCNRNWRTDNCTVPPYNIKPLVKEVDIADGWPVNWQYITEYGRNKNLSFMENLAADTIRMYSDSYFIVGITAWKVYLVPKNVRVLRQDALRVSETVIKSHWNLDQPSKYVVYDHKTVSQQMFEDEFTDEEQALTAVLNVVNGN